MTSRNSSVAAILIVMCLAAVPVSAQTLVAVDDEYGVRFDTPLVVEQPGVMTNDTYGGSPVSGATVTLVGYPSDGALECESDPVTYDLCPDGSFTYTPGSSFSGFDSFTYEVSYSGQTDQATVTIAACTGGPTQYVCWSESAYLAQLGALGGYELIQEGFEDDAVWGVTRPPLTAPSVVSQGVRWESNHPDPPASNELVTGGGPARTGLWGLYDPEHGYATGTPAECDITNPPDYCLFKDGFTGTREGGGLLYGAGGYLKGSAQPNLSMYLDGGARIGLGRLTVGGHQFFGVIDTGGFSTFRIEETDGKVGQERYVFGDDMILATSTADTVPPRVTLVNSWYDTGDGELTEGEVTDTAIFQLLVSFSEPVRDVFGNGDPHDVTNPANYLLVNDGGDGFETASCAGGVAGNDVAVSVDWVTWEGSPGLTATLDLNGGVDLPVASYRLYVCGTTSIHDWAGHALDGDGNGVGGDDFVRNFTVYYPPNDPPTAHPQSVTTPEDTAKAIVLTGSDPNSDPLSFFIVTGPSHGGLAGTPPNVIYTPTLNSNGPDSFTFRAFDGALYSAPATVSITVTPVNDPPTANDQSVTTPEDTALAITLTGGDVDGDPLTFAIGSGPTHGGLTGTPPNVTYTPDANYNGPDSFTFTTTDGTFTSPPATVSITVTPVNDVPLAVDDSAATDEDVAVSIDVLANDGLGDPPTTVTSVTQGTSGSVSIDAGALTVTYTPDGDFNGPDSFTYTITDADLETSTATVAMTVNAVNDAPVANAGPDQTVFVTDTVTLDGSASYDVDGDPLTYAWSLTTVPVGSTASLSDPTAVMPSFVVDVPGDYMAELIVSDGTLFSTADAVTISTTNSAPVADAGPDQTAQVTDTVTLDGSASYDVDGDSLTYAWSFTSVPAGSTASLNDPTAMMPSFVVDGPGDYVVQLIVSDPTTSSAPDTVTVSTTNSAPTADPQSLATPEDTAVGVTLTGSDVDGDPITFEVVTGPSLGALTGTLPNLTFTPSANAFGPDSFTFRAFDGALYSAPATVSIDVLPVNDPPTADPQSVTTPEDTAVGITLTGGDVDGDPLTFAIGSGPTHGGLTGTPPNVTYTPDANYNGADSFSFTSSDGTLTSPAATVSISVTPAADPVLTVVDASVIEPDAGSATVAVTITVTDPGPSDITVDFTTADGSATAGLDYAAASGTATIPALVTALDLEFEVLGDPMDEPDETFSVSLSNPFGASLGSPSVSTVTILDNDPMAQLSAADVSVGEAAGTADVQLSLDEPSGFDVTVNAATADGTATSPGDYGAVNQPATIPAGSTSTTVSVPIVDDSVVEPDETFTVDFSAQSNAVLLTPSVTVTISDDDGCDIPGDADLNCVLDANDIALIITIIDDPSVIVPGDPDCDGSGAAGAADLVCVVEGTVAQ